MSWLRALALFPAVCTIGCGTRSLDPHVGSGGKGGSTAAVDAGRDLVERPPPIVIVEPHVCGDGVLGPNEACDDNNRSGGDGCSALCQLECFSSCGGRCGPPGTCGPPPPPRCGDWRRDIGEACDDGNTVSGDGCEDRCRFVELGWNCPAAGRPCFPSCGDGMKVGPETCDDSNEIAGDGCSAICLTEPGDARCGDGVISGAEECDDGAKNDDTVYGGCTTRCRLAACGDQIVNGPEECDEGSGYNNVTYGNKDGCGVDCKLPHFCGDAIVDTDEGEQCDFGPANGEIGSNAKNLAWPCSRDCKVLLI